MILFVGKKMVYNYPTPNNANEKCFIGIIDFIGESIVVLKDETNKVLKVTSRNFHLLKSYTNK